ncbi:MAG TPA: hypothetical protein VM142_04600 [Acidimicrobiales bacterium]|nr:hypothetical protein [Acidimicrobiales bacterium]
MLFDADSPELVVKWLRRHGRKARVWRVPASTVDTGSSLSVHSWGLLGQRSFFHFFTVTFRASDFEFDIEPRVA